MAAEQTKVEPEPAEKAPAKPERKTQRRPARKDAAGNVVFIGIKPVMNYVLAVITQFNEGNGEVVLKARGRAISRAVDVAEITRHRFLKELVVKDIKIGTEEVTGDRGTSNVSTVEVTLVKGA